MNQNTTYFLRRAYAKYKNQRLEFKIKPENSLWGYKTSLCKNVKVSGIFCDIKSKLKSNGTVAFVTLFFRGVFLLDENGKVIDSVSSEKKKARKLITKLTLDKNVIDFSWDNIKNMGVLK